LLKPETCTRTRCPMPSAVLRGTFTNARAGASGGFGGWGGTATAMLTWSASARKRSPQPVAVILPCPFAPHDGHVARTLPLLAHQVNHGVAGVLCASLTMAPSFQVASLTATLHPFCIRGNRASLWAKYHFLHSHLPSQTSKCIAGSVSQSSSHMSAHWCHSNMMLPTLRVGQRAWFSET